MNSPPDRAQFLIRFGCGVIFFGLTVALLGLRFVTSVAAPAIAAWLVITIALSVLVALRGDDAWRGLASFFRWW